MCKLKRLSGSTDGSEDRLRAAVRDLGPGARQATGVPASAAVAERYVPTEVFPISSDGTYPTRNRNDKQREILIELQGAQCAWCRRPTVDKHRIIF
ncbi:hypothetical protein EVAR_8902_1 [Eumeta japonica]|uniref:Uncharacterized protein n=1 Tax=Eumeta variegata TaxID=151549 RepID=A0A4C1U0A4_EUMVA|nr:hypothetical protein EVAR_8902_1 [Eumeta japonica]